MAGAQPLCSRNQSDGQIKSFAAKACCSVKESGASRISVGGRKGRCDGLSDRLI